jgi:hypothetical protein
MARILRCVGLVLTMAAFSIGAWLAYRETTEPPPGTALIVHEPDRDLGEIPGGPIAVTFRISNTGRAAGWLLNVAEG